MQKVTVRKTELIKRLEENMAKHNAIFLAAMEGYREQALRQVNDWIDALKRFDNPVMISRLPVPEEHTDDYKTAIEMLKMSVDLEVEISQSDFRCYVQDKWEWKQRFVSTNTAYLVE